MLLFLNDIAGSEILLILVFILIFFGSKSIPGIARTMGRTIRQIKDASSEIQNEIKKSSGDMRKDLNLDGIIRETASEVRKPLDQMADDLDNAVKYTPPKRVSHLENPKTQEPNTGVVVDTEITEDTNETSESQRTESTSESAPNPNQTA